MQKRLEFIIQNANEQKNFLKKLLVEGRTFSARFYITIALSYKYVNVILS